MVFPVALVLTFAAGLLAAAAAFWHWSSHSSLRQIKLTDLDKLPLPLWRRGRDLAISWANKSGLDLFGPAKPDQEFDQSARLLAERAHRYGKPATESRSLVVDGTARIMDMVEMPLADGSLLGFAIDQTALEAIQAELVRHVSAHREMLQNLHSAIFIFGHDKRLNFFNQAAADLFGLEHAHLDDAPTMEEWLNLLRERRRLPEYADFRSFSRDFVRQVMTLVGPAEELIHNPQGQTFRMLANPHPLGGTVLTFEDVTDRLALERKYNTLIEVQKETIDHLIEGVAVYGADGRLKLFNRAFADMWHLDPAYLTGEPHLSRLIDRLISIMPDHPELVRRLIDDLSLRETRKWRLELKDQRIIDITAVPLIDGSRLYQYADVTDTLLKARALEERNAALLAADRLKSEFLANVSYEFRTPLNAIVGYAELLRREYFGQLNERQKDYTAAILDSGNDLVELISNVIDVAAIEAGYVRLEPKPIALGSLLDDCVRLLKPRQMARKIAFTASDFSNLGTIQGDERRLKQAFGSLLSMAFSTAVNGSKISFTAERIPNYVEITIAQGEENGERGDVLVADRGRDAANGLSLVLAKNLVELHGGQISTGTTPVSWRVTCRLPA